MFLIAFLFGASLMLERLEYDIKCGPLVLGSMVLERLPEDTIDSIVCEHLRASVKIDGGLTMLFWANYQMESWCRAQDLVTVRYFKRTREKNYQAEWYADYDHEARVVRYSDGENYLLPDSARDLLALWFYLRDFPWEKVDSVVLNSHIDRQNQRLVFITTGRRMVRTGLGKFEALTISPRTSGPLGTIFLTTDSRRLPVVIRTRIGAITVSAFLARVRKTRR